ncbi:MAG: integral rane protein [Frankiales bacterium]|nr:integral rane protein [Frankiales bacterium]
MNDVLAAAGWGLLAGAALLVGAAVAWFLPVPKRLVALVMAFGAGVLVSALAFELVAEAADSAGLAEVVAGFAAGALVYTGANVALARYGARHRKRSSGQQSEGSGTALAVGALLDGIPESAVIGVSLLGGGGVSVATVVAIFLSNLPEGLSSAAGMRAAGHGARYVFGLWAGIAVASGVAAAGGLLAGDALGVSGVAVVTAFAAGAILAMISDTMLPEAVEGAPDATGLSAAAGFLAAFALHRSAG